ncbi:cytochrome c oxidase subunit 3 family protein [bacterium]|nr:MAG: cytochrome c oxidase subunit 3 family protein [bacterium]
MSAIAHPADHGHDDHGPLHHQFEDIAQQNETYIVGMWTFLVTEVMFFGAFFLMYTIYRMYYQVDFWKAHEHLDVKLGGINTMVLLLSSFFMVMAVQGAQLHNRRQVIGNLGLVQICAFIFLGIKAVEYSAKFADNLFPGPNFQNNAAILHGANLNHAQMFYGLYFGMTGLHAVHIIVGMLIIGALMAEWYKRNRLVTQDFIPTELVGLYWHFVDLVWIFLFPLMYLMPKPH